MAYIFGFVMGLVIGWNVLPQPVWVKTIYGKIVSYWSAKPDLH